MKEFKFSLRAKIKFYGQYFINKIFGTWFEVKTPKLKVFIYEFIYSFNKLFPAKFLEKMYPENIDYMETRFGKFHLRPGTMDLICASPAFERPDVNYLIRLIEAETSKEHKILFVDIGADFGTYSVIVGNMFKHYRALQIIGFEPSSSSFNLFKKNIEENGLSATTSIINRALSSHVGDRLNFHFNDINPGNNSVLKEEIFSRQSDESLTATTLDLELIDLIDQYDVIFIKMDVEGFEKSVLEGAKRLIASHKPVILLVEDFVDPRIVSYLQENGATFISKRTSYNSFWIFNATMSD